MAASYECHDELPRWLKMGVETCPFRLCSLGFSFVPARILSSARLGCRAWIVLGSVRHRGLHFRLETRCVE